MNNMSHRHMLAAALGILSFAASAAIEPFSPANGATVALLTEPQTKIMAIPTYAERLAALPGSARILIAEACTHKPLHEDIGRVKLPRLLRKKLGDGISITVTAGKDFPPSVSGYDMVIHCGACMFNRQYVLSRVRACREQQVPMTNYGLAIAALLGILPMVALPNKPK
jgi:hypothetical protein